MIPGEKVFCAHCGSSFAFDDPGTSWVRREPIKHFCRKICEEMHLEPYQDIKKKMEVLRYEFYEKEREVDKQKKRKREYKQKNQNNEVTIKEMHEALLHVTKKMHKMEEQIKDSEDRKRRIQQILQEKY